MLEILEFFKISKKPIFKNKVLENYNIDQS